jgi:hypothetical protein
MPGQLKMTDKKSVLERNQNGVSGDEPRSF